MSLTLADIAFLTSGVGQRILSEYATADVSDRQTLRLITDLRKSFSLEQASAILTTVRLRQKAIDKFPEFADKLLFTDDSLQQASDPRIRQYRAQLLSDLKIIDLCCSIGSDALEFARIAHSVQGYDIDSVRIAIARYNANVMQLPVQFDIADVTQITPEAVDFIFYDPARRTPDGKRIFDVERYIPPLSLIKNFRATEIAVKLSPAVDLSQLHAYGGQVEFISVEGELKEAVLWKNRSLARPIATLISEEIYHFTGGYPAEVDLMKPREWLFEPDPTILRAGLVQHLAETLSATLLDETIAYLTMDSRHDTPWGRYWRVVDWMPFNLKKLRHYLVAHDIGQVTVKKRGFPMSPEEVIHKLKLKQGQESCVLVMTRLRGEPIVLICAEN